MSGRKASEVPTSLRRASDQFERWRDAHELGAQIARGALAIGRAVSRDTRREPYREYAQAGLLFAEETSSPGRLGGRIVCGFYADDGVSGTASLRVRTT